MVQRYYCLRTQASFQTQNSTFTHKFLTYVKKSAAASGACSRNNEDGAANNAAPSLTYYINASST